MKGPLMKVDQVARLPLEDNGRSICRVLSRHIDGKRESREEKFFRDDPVTITNKSNGKKIVRFSVGNGNFSLTQNQIGLDYNSRDKLGVNRHDASSSVNIEVRLATLTERFMFFWCHEDRVERVAFRGMVFGSVNAIIGTMLGLLSLYLALSN